LIETRKPCYDKNYGVPGNIPEVDYNRFDCIDFIYYNQNSLKLIEKVFRKVFSGNCENAKFGNTFFCD
jgi:hypothetical protein